MRTRFQSSLTPLLFVLALATSPPASLAQEVGAPPSPPEPTQEQASAPPDAAPPADDLAESVAIARRLQEAEGLADVSVTVRDGVAQLEGMVLTEEDRTRAAQVAAQQPGVTRVDNRVALSTRFSDRFAAASGLAIDQIVGLLAALPLLLVAIIVVGLAWWLGQWLGERLHRRMSRRSWQPENPYVASLVRQLVQWLVLLGGVLVALNLLGATTLVGAVMGSAGVIGLALGFAFKDIAENYVAGILLSIRRPFSPGELLRIDNTHEGRVAALTSRATVLVTPDGNRLTLPNALVFKSVVLNFSSNARRRLEFVIPVDGTESIRCVQELVLEAVRGVDGVLEDPGPSWTVDSYDAAGITLRFFAWVDQTRSDLGKVRSEAIHAARTRLAEAGVSAPRNIQFTAVLPEAEAEALPVAGAARARDRGGPVDTSVNHDLDDHLAAEQHAHAGEDLLPQEAEATPRATDAQAAR